MEIIHENSFSTGFRGGDGPVRLTLKYKIAAGCVLLLLTVQYGLVPLYNWQASLRAHVQKLNRSLSRKKDLLGHMDGIQERWQRMSTRLQETEHYYQSDFTDAQALQLNLQKKIEGMCAEAGIKISNVNWLPVSESSIVRAPVKFRLEITPGKFYRLIHNLENDPLFYSIDILRITTRPDSETFTAELDVSAYGINKDAPSDNQTKHRP